MIRLGSVVLLWLVALPALSAPFQNGSFESGAFSPCNSFNLTGSGIIAGWTINVGNVDWEGAPFPACGWVASNGNNSLDMVGTGGIGGIQQTFDTVPGTTYQVSFDMAGNFGAPPLVKPLAVTINGVTTNFTFDTTGRSGNSMGWTTHTVTFTAASTSSTISFVSDVTASGGTQNAGAALDNVRIVAVGGGPVATAIPLDWAQWAAILLILATAPLLFRRSNGSRRR